MKKSISAIAAIILLAGCSGSSSAAPAAESPDVSPKAEDTGVKSEGVMTYAEYDAANLDTKVTVETYVQAKQSLRDNKVTLYTQDADGAYFIYDLPITEDDYNRLAEGTKIKVTGYKSEWSGEVEIIDGEYEIEAGSYIAEPLDVTDLLGTDDLAKHQNKKVSFRGMTVVAAGQDDTGNDVAFLYNWDGSGERGNDVYFNVSKDGEIYTFLVRGYLTDENTDVYKAAEALQIGDTIDMEGFLYWYEGVNPHITAIKKTS